MGSERWSARPEAGAPPRPSDVSVGIIAGGRRPALTRLVSQLHSLEEPPAEVIVAIETPGVSEVRETRDHRGTRWLHIPARRGLGYNRNRLLEAVRSEFLVFADDDCEPQEGWLPELIAPLADSDVAGVVGRVHIPPAGFLGDAISALGFPAGGSAGYETMFTVEEDGTTDNLTTCNCAIRTSVFREVGGFDESMTFGGEDTEFGRRMSGAGHRLVYHPKALVQHDARRDLGEFGRWFYRRGRAKRQFSRKATGVGALVGKRLASYGRILHDRRTDPKIVAIVPLLIASVALQQAGFIAEWIRPTRPGA